MEKKKHAEFTVSGIVGLPKLLHLLFGVAFIKISKQ